MDRRSSPGLSPRNDGPSRIQKPESAVDKAAKLAALKARVSAAIGTTTKAKGGLNVGLHPALEDLASWKPASKSADSHPSSSSSSNQRPRDSRANDHSRNQKPLDLSGPSAEEIKQNPYYDASLGAPTVKPRQSRQLIFNQKGKYIQQANALRRQAALEALKKKIALQSRKAGIDDDIDVEKNYVVDEPPEIEWWDEGLVAAPNYDSIESPAALKIDTDDTIITSYIQHPVAIEPPQDQHVPAPKPMFLTSDEQAKLRRQRRMADLKEEQAKVRLGLVPAPPPKVKKGNLMRVLGEEAVKDPTAVEARVNKEIADRHNTHLQTNEDRKLTKEQRHEKLAKNQAQDVAMGVHMLVFKVNTLANGQHRFKISKNADQLNLKGLVIMHPKQNLVIVEGGEHSINQYKKLMLNRIDWVENAPSRDRSNNNSNSTPESDNLRDWLRAEDEKGDLKDLALNKCQLLFEGEVKTQTFNSFRSRICETDADARHALSRGKLDSFWNMAKSTT
ncbi:putative U4/U6 small nuclear ribonucleoprotein [Xylariaceae sp. FL1272]|nr:putative U4/U6 small nuclear ribonucleoprotein [Xylariaceae sp. FL1272]